MKINYKYILLFSTLFIVFLVWELFVVEVYADEVWNYGFSYYMSKGLIPYKDFNMIITPLFPMMMSFFFTLFGSNMLVFHIVNALVLTSMSIILYKLIKNKMFIALILLFIPSPNIFPSYNLFVTFLFVLLIYLEKNKKNDYLIGLIIGLTILTKQSVGLCLLLPSLYYFKDIKKILKRLVGIIIPIIIFVIYLLINGNLMGFLDLCIFGLFDFTSNKPPFNYMHIISIIYIIICLYLIKKNHKNINNYYALAIFSMTIPLFDIYHFQLSLFGLLIILFMDHNIKIKVNEILLFFGIIIGVGLIEFLNRNPSKIIYPNKINNFEYRLVSTEHINYTNKINKYLNKHKDRETVFLTNNAYYIRLSRNENISYLDLINYGNHGYNGNKKLMDLIKSKKDALFIVDKDELLLSKQTNKNVINYVIKNAKKVDKVGNYDIYIFGGEYEK